MLASFLLAQGFARSASAAILDLLWIILALIGVVLASALLIVWIGRWAKRPPPQRWASGSELALLRSLYEQGEWSQEEYEQIRAKLRQKLRQELKTQENPSTAAVPSTEAIQTPRTGEVPSARPAAGEGQVQDIGPNPS